MSTLLLHERNRTPGIYCLCGDKSCRVDIFESPRQEDMDPFVSVDAWRNIGAGFSEETS